VDDEELEIGQVDRKEQTDTRQTHEHHVPLPLRERRGPQRRQCDDEHGDIPHHTVERDGQSEEDGPLARLYCLAPTGCTALDRPSEAERVQPQIERDEQADEREQRDRLAMAHQ